MLKLYFYIPTSHAVTLQFGEGEGGPSSPAPATDVLQSHADAGVSSAGAWVWVLSPATPGMDLNFRLDQRSNFTSVFFWLAEPMSLGKQAIMFYFIS